MYCCISLNVLNMFTFYIYNTLSKPLRNGFTNNLTLSEMMMKLTQPTVIGTI